MKNHYLITGAATKYWKKAIKNDRVMVCNKDGYIYILNGYNAFKMPAVPYLWDVLARPAFMVDMPEPGAAFQYDRGEKREAIAADIAFKIDSFLTNTAPAERLPFMFDSLNITARLYKLNTGTVVGVDVKYDEMVNASMANAIYCGGKYAPVVFINDQFVALLMPVKLCDVFPEKVATAFDRI